MDTRDDSLLEDLKFARDLAGLPADGPVERPTASFHPDAKNITIQSLAVEPSTVPQAPPLLSALPPVIGKYEILSRLGQGGMGIVLKARDTQLDRIVALKLLNLNGVLNQTLRKRFLSEQRLQANLVHRNVLPIFDAGEWGVFPFFTMQYMPNGTLAAAMDRLRGDRPKAITLLAKVARAVNFLHSNGLLHRDLKPLNILMGEADEPLVADFGLAKTFGHETTVTAATGYAVGTRPYMSPEQTRGESDSLTPSCDIWAMGVMLHELIGGRRPFESDDVVDLYRKIQEEEPPPLGEGDQRDRQLELVARKCLAKKPGERYASGEELAADLDRWLAGEKVEAKPAGRSRIGRRTMIATTGCAVVAGGLWATVGDATPEPLQPTRRKLLGSDAPPSGEFLPYHGGQIEVAADGTLRLIAAKDKVVYYRLGRVPVSGTAVRYDATMRSAAGEPFPTIAGLYFWNHPIDAQRDVVNAVVLMTRGSPEPLGGIRTTVLYVGADNIHGDFPTDAELLQAAWPLDDWHTASVDLTIDTYRTAWTGRGTTLPSAEGTRLELNRQIAAKAVSPKVRGRVGNWPAARDVEVGLVVLNGSILIRDAGVTIPSPK